MDTILHEYISFFRGVKANVTFHAVMERVTDLRIQERHFFTPFQTFTALTQISDRLAFIISYLNVSLELMSERYGSFWRVKELKSVIVKILPYQPRETAAT